MKKILLTLALAVTLMGCGGGNSPEGVVEKCWERLSKGDIEGAVELMNAQADEKALYCQIFTEQSGELQSVGGIEDFQVTGTNVGATDATVDAVVRLKNGQQIEATYTLVKSNKGWLIAE